MFSGFFVEILIICSVFELGTLNFHAIFTLDKMKSIRSTPGISSSGSRDIEKASRLSFSKLMKGDSTIVESSDWVSFATTSCNWCILSGSKICEGFPCSITVGSNFEAMFIVCEMTVVGEVLHRHGVRCFYKLIIK